MKLSLRVQVLDEDGAQLSEVTVRGIPDDLQQHPTDPFADREGRLREAAGAAAYSAHQKARLLLDARVAEDS